MTEMKWRDLSPFERALLGALLAPNFPGKEQLVNQLAKSKVVPIDENGSLKFNVQGALPALEVKYRVPTEGEFTDADGIAVHLLLHVIDGYIDELEVYKEDSSQIRDWSRATSMRIFAPE